jgi:hypothetical protein
MKVQFRSTDGPVCAEQPWPRGRRKRNTAARDSRFFPGSGREDAGIPSNDFVFIGGIKFQYDEIFREYAAYAAALR